MLRVTWTFCGFFLTGLDDSSGFMITGSSFATVSVSVVSFTSGDGRAGIFEACLTGSALDRSVAGASVLPGDTGSSDVAGSNGSIGSAGMSGASVVFSDCGAGAVAVFVSATGCFSPVGLAGFVITGGTVLSVLSGIDSGVVSVSLGAVSVATSSSSVCWGLSGSAASTVDV